MRKVITRGVFFGADQRGQLYSYSTGLERDPCTICKVFVQSVTGQLLSSFTLPNHGVGFSPASYFVDRSGSVYDLLGQCQIQQFAPGSRGVVKPMRTIKIAPLACMGPNPPENRFRIFVDSKGAVFFRGFNGKNNKPGVGESYALYIWAPGASGAVKPARFITGPQYNAAFGSRVLGGVDSKGHIWMGGGLEPDRVYEYPPSAKGDAKAIVVPLLGTKGWSGAVLVPPSDNLVYLGQSPQNPDKIGVLKVSPPGGMPTRTIKSAAFISDLLLISAL
jgi:hypothetical protein